MSLLTAYAKFIQQALKYGFSLFGTAKSGQTTSYRTGDDGAHEKGYPKSGTRFIDNGDGTVTDMASGLIWAKDGAGEGCAYGSTLSWNDAIDFANGLTFAGHSDWRLPNAKELLSIIDFGRSNEAIDPIFTNTYGNYYWTGTTYTAVTTLGYVTNFDNGAGMFKDKTITYPVRAVRGG